MTLITFLCSVFSVPPCLSTKQLAWLCGQNQHQLKLAHNLSDILFELSPDWTITTTIRGGLGLIQKGAPLRPSLHDALRRHYRS